jgi:uncharacterized protein
MLYIPLKGAQMQPLPQHLWIAFAGGILAFAHCLGMCGGFVVHLSQEQDRRKMLVGQLLWQLGRLCSYTFLGGMAAFAGRFVQTTLLQSTQFQNLLSYLAGGIILAMGLSLLGLFPVAGKGSGGGLLASLSLQCGRLFTQRSPGSALFLGIATGFLPCPIILAFLAFALQSGSVLDGMAVMAALGLGTMVPLLLLGGVTRLTGIHLRNWGRQAGAVILVLLGIATSLRGTTAFHHLLGCASAPIQPQAQADPVKPCCTGKMHANGSGN